MFIGPKIVTDGLVFAVDAGSTKSYPGSGTTWYDLSGNGNGGTLTNGPTFDSGNGGSVVFDGVDDYIKVSNANTGPLTTIGTGDGTISSWASNNGSSAYRWILSNWGNGTGVHFGMNSFNSYFGGYFGDNLEIRSDYSIPNDSSWHFYVVTRNSGNIKFYVDGTERAVSSGTVSGKNGSFSSNVETRIGTRTFGNSLIQLWSGSISQTQIYNRALTPQEIQQNYNSTKSRFI